MIQTGYSLVSVDNIELQQFNALPNPIKLTNGDDVHGALSGEVFPDSSRLLPVFRVDNSPGPWHKRLHEEREVTSDKIIVTVVYSELPNIDDERSHMACTPFQGRIALANAGLLSQVEAAVTQADSKTKVAWEYALEWQRNSPLIATLMAALSISETQADDLFREAAKVTA